MDRGIPLKEMHLSPTSRMSSAAWTLEPFVDATLWREARDSGELRVKVAADWSVLARRLRRELVSRTYRDCNPRLQTDVVLRSLVRNGLVDLCNARCRGSGIATRKGRIDERLEARRELGHCNCLR